MPAAQALEARVHADSARAHAVTNLARNTAFAWFIRQHKKWQEAVVMNSSATMENIYLDARGQLLQPMLTCEAVPHTPNTPSTYPGAKKPCRHHSSPPHDIITWTYHTAVLQLGYTTA